ncbi:MAG: type II secretion system protein [Candidatus Erginobacter occultus]|nr:type II secretion system protein [Candidatus Erginobacter occultus]
MPKTASRAGSGHTLIELVVVMVLITILAGAAFMGILRAIDLYTLTTRDYLEVFQEGKVALEKIVREIRETTPGNVIVGGESIEITKKSGHTTEADNSLAVTFFKNGDKLQRTSLAGTFDLVENVTVFNPARDGDTGVVTIDFTLEKGGNTIRLRTAALPRQRPSPIPVP